MGRHSAPDEEPDPSDAPTVVLEAVQVDRAARHQHADTDAVSGAEDVSGTEVGGGTDSGGEVVTRGDAVAGGGAVAASGMAAGRAARVDRVDDRRASASDESDAGESGAGEGGAGEGGAGATVELAEREAEGATGTEADPEHDAPPRAPRPEGATHADLRLLRENPALRARCAAAVVVPFLLYTLAMIVLGSTAIYLVWVWVPTVAAGVTVGTFLDLAHRRER